MSWLVDWLVVNSGQRDGGRELNKEIAKSTNHPPPPPPPPHIEIVEHLILVRIPIHSIFLDRFQLSIQYLHVVSSRSFVTLSDPPDASSLHGLVCLCSPCPPLIIVTQLLPHSRPQLVLDSLLFLSSRPPMSLRLSMTVAEDVAVCRIFERTVRVPGPLQGHVPAACK